MKGFENRRVLLFSDTHAPYHHKNTLDFLTEVKEEFNPDRVFHLGDLGDIYNVSDYPKSLDHPHTWKDEIKRLRKFTTNLANIFPHMILLDSNHDSRIYKKSRVSGIPREAMLSYLEVIGAPDTWKSVRNARFRAEKNKKHWLLMHTVSGGCVTAAKQLAINVAVGHSHTKFGMQAFDNGTNVFYGVDTGCLISDEGPSFAYNKTQLGRPIRGCCIILDGIPRLIPMD